MNCTNCGKEIQENAAFCTGCGAKLIQEPKPAAPKAAPETAYVPQQSQYTQPQTQTPAFQEEAAPVLPAAYKPLSAWAYFGYQLLFSIPLVGFVLLIVFACGGCSNINLKNFARSYFCGLVVALGVIILTVILIIAMGGSLAVLEELKYY